MAVDRSKDHRQETAICRCAVVIEQVASISKHGNGLICLARERNLPCNSLAGQSDNRIIPPGQPGFVYHPAVANGTKSPAYLLCAQHNVI